MNLYLISQNKNKTYDSYRSAVVCAETIKEARWTHPDEDIIRWDGTDPSVGSMWCAVKDVKVSRIGKARPGIKRGTILASFNAN